MRTASKILCFLLLIAVCSYGQSPVITDSTTTPSICFNDGTITLMASGGSGSYTFSIISGPSYPNISYPISLPTGTSVFSTIPKGEYRIKVVDGAGSISYATATVGGTYTFPVINPPPPDTVYSSCITVSTQGGRLPYHYAISSVSTNAGFGPYQSSATFCHLCDGRYWIRVMDSCSNIFTTNKITVHVPIPQYSVSYQSIGHRDSIEVSVITAGAPPYVYHLNSGSISVTNTTGIFTIPRNCPPDSITVTDSCGRIYHTSIDIHALQAKVTSICGSGSATIKIDSSAIAPYTITGSNGSLVTHQNTISFNSLPVDSHYHFAISDSCGHIVNLTTTCLDTSFFYNVCPFDSSIHMRPNPVQFCYPVVVTCLSCTPVQIDTILSTPARLFTGIQLGVPYRIRIRDQCGFDYLTADTPGLASLVIGDSILTCRDFSVFSIPPVFTPPIHFTLFDNTTFIDSIIANHATFFHLPPATYRVTATQPLCLAATITVKLPAIGGACLVEMFDSTCTPSYAIYQNITSYTETYTLVNTITAARYIQVQPSPYPSAILFDDVPVGNYNLVSDSGCSFPFVLPAFTPHTISAISSHQCTGEALIQVACSPPIQSCNTSQSSYYVLLKDNQYISGSSTGRFTVLDTGYYVVRLFLSNTSIFVFPTRYDTICPIDTALIYVTNNVIPNIVSTQVEVCGHVKGNIPYTIFGGSAPYTVQILGYPARTVTSTKDTFPDVYPGVYTMIVSDYCGISRSFSVSVIDTCSPICLTRSAFSLSDSIVCVYGTVYMNNHSIAASHYRWDIDGHIFAYGADTSFTTATPGRYIITLHAYIGVCADSSSKTIVIDDTIHSQARLDTTLCKPFNLRLNTHTANTLWSGGQMDSILAVSSPGLYLASVSNACGSASDTFNISTYPGITGFDLTNSKNTLCESVHDSILLNASIDQGQPAVLFSWNTGVKDPAAYSSGIIAYQAGIYQVSVDNGFCPLVKMVTIDSISCDSECIAGIAIPNIFSPNGDNRNDTFYILHICEFHPFEMHIYDRWGQLVFESQDITKGWDGKYKGTPQPEEVYWLWLSMTLPDGKTFYRSGNVTLVR
jgi:gliding motility-associated-like protein